MSDIPETPKSRWMNDEPGDSKISDAPETPKSSMDSQSERRRAPLRLLTAADVPESEHSSPVSPSRAQPKQREKDDFHGSGFPETPKASVNRHFKGRRAPIRLLTAADVPESEQKFGITFWKSVTRVLFLLFAVCLGILVVYPYSQNSMLNKVHRIVDYNKISDGDTVFTLSLTGQWANGQLNDPLIISLVGTSDKLFPVMDSLTKSAASAVGQNNGDMLFLNEDMSRTHIHQLFMAAHSESGKYNSTVIALYNAEKKSEDVHMILRRIYDHRDPVFHRTLILLGVVVDKMHIENCIKDNLNRYLSFQCLADDFPFNVAPFFHLPYVRTIFIK